MADNVNIANAILILGALYFGYAYGFDIGHFILIFWGLGFWAYHGFTDERKRLYEAKIRVLNAKADYYREKARGAAT